MWLHSMTERIMWQELFVHLKYGGGMGVDRAVYSDKRIQYQSHSPPLRNYIVLILYTRFEILLMKKNQWFN